MVQSVYKINKKQMTEQQTEKLTLKEVMELAHWLDKKKINKNKELGSAIKKLLSIIENKFQAVTLTEEF